MKKRFLPISLLLTIIILAQTSFIVNANGGSGKYTPRTSMQATAQSFMKSIRANQETGLIDPAWLVATENSQVRNGNELNWTSLGPDNYGSLTRAIVYDKNDATNKTLYIGTMGGGIFETVNGGITWRTISDNMMASCMVQTEDGTIFIGTGDGRNAKDQNGLANFNYETSFVGSGIYKLGSNEPMEGTTEWSFVNALAAYGNIVYAATDKGLFRYEENTWTAMVDTIAAQSVKVCPDGKVLATIGDEVCLFKGEECEVLSTDETGKIDETGKLPKGTTYKIIATSPSDANYMYVAYLTKANGTNNIYMTSDGGATWVTAYTHTAMYDIFVNRGLLDHAMVVYPNDPKKLLIGGQNVWVMKDETNTGIFRMECVSEGKGFQIAQSSGAFYYNYKYVHSGIQSIVFNPSNPNEFFVGTEGGVFKGSYSTDNGYLFEGANRYFETAENHTSVARMFSVAYSDTENMIIGGSLDHGTINIYGDPNTNNITTGSAIYPNDIATTDAAATYGSFDYTKAGGPCAISTINHDIMFVTTTGSHSTGTARTPILRTQTAGADYDKENFSYSATDKSSYITNDDAFRTPIALFENYNDLKSTDSVKYYAKKDYVAGDSITDVKSSNCDYPFTYVLTEDLKNGDSIMIQDILSSTFLIAVKGKVSMTRDALKFNKKAAWWTISKITGTPSALTISTDGDVAYVGTLAGKLYKISGLSDAVSANLAEGIPAQLEARTEIYDTLIKEVKKFDTIWAQKPVYDTTFANDTAWINDTIIKIEQIIINDTTFKTKTVYDTIAPAVPSIVTTKEIDATAFNGRAITSVAIDPNNTDRVIATLGNYGNEDYVFYATDGETFTAVQNLPKVPVYSSLIEKTSGLVIIGTEKGIYTSEDMVNWTADNVIANVPVMDIKQQTQSNRPNRYIYLVDEVGDVTTVEYSGITNSGMVYIATYGKGLYKCDNFVNTTTESIEENTTMVNSLELNIFPNPVETEATINFNIEESTMVSYQIYDLSGRMVQNATLGNYGQGTHSVKFNVENLKTGSYIVKLQAGTVSSTSKILVY